MDYHIFAPLLAALVIFGFGAAVYFHNRQSKIHLSYSVFIFLVALWSLGIALFYYSKDSATLSFLADFLYFVGGTIPVLFFYFSLLFPDEKLSFSRLKRFLIFSPTVIFFVLYFFSDFILTGVQAVGNARVIGYGPGHILFDIHFVLFFLLAFITLTKKYFQYGSIIKRQLLFIIIGTSIGAILASITNVILPWIDNFDFFWLGPELSLVWIGFIAYTIIRHRLLDIKLFILQSVFFILTVTLIGGLFTLILAQIWQESSSNFVNDTSSSDRIFFAVSGLLNGLVALFFGAVGYERNPRIFLNKIFGLMNLSITFWGVSYWFWLRSEDADLALLWSRILSFFATFIPVFFLHWILTLLKCNKGKKGLIYASYFVTIGLSIFSFTPWYVDHVSREMFFEYWPKPGPVYHVFIISYITIFGSGCYYLLRAYFSKSGFEKQQVKYVLLGIAVGVAGGFTNFPLWYGIKIPPYGNFLVIAYIVGFAYAMLKYRLMDIRLFVIRSILYTLTVIMVGGLFTLIVFSLGENILGSTFWGVIIGSVIISLGLEPLLHFLRRVTDQYFFQEKYNYQKTLKELVESMTKIIDLQNLLDTTTATIKGALRIERIAIVLWDEDNSLPLEVKQVGFSVPLDTHFSKKKPLVQHLASTKDELVAGELEIEMERGRLNMPMARAQSIVREMRNLDIAVCFPIISNDNLIGILALGNKQSGDVFSDDDIKLLNTFSYQAGIAIVNARLYQEVKDFNAKLQEKIDRATEHLRKKNEELHKANIKLKELDQAKSDFLSLASHQLRAPLSITKGYVSMILEGTYGACPQEMIDPLEMVYNGNERLVKFVNNLLDVSRMESGRLEYIFKEVDLAEMASSVVKELKLAADKKDLYLDLKIDNSVPKIQADDEKLRQVVMNLVDNAIKYTAKGGVSVNLKHGKNKEGKNGLIFSVTDTGRGMEENDKASLFQKFSRGKGISRIHTEGTGLGLYVAAKIVEAHHGIIWADSPGKDQGSTFAFWVPAGE